MSDLLAVENLSVLIGGRAVVRGVSFAIGRERIGIVGESGAGKSMLGRAIMRLLPPGASMTGRVLFDGAAFSPGLRGKRVALVLQDPRFSLNPAMAVGDQIAEVLRTHRGMTHRAARQETLRLLDSVRIREPEMVYRRYPHQLSGGMGQRAMIAMMLAPDPDLLIADEPTSALDASVAGGILALLDAEIARRSMGIILISHDLDLVASFCDRVLVMKDGAVVEALAARDLAEAQHPYTRQLMAARLRLGSMIEARNIVARHGERAVVNGVSFDVADGESFGIVGESGSGKSTLLRVIAGLHRDWSGTLAIAGEGQGRYRPRTFGRTVSMVFQDPYGSLHPRQTVERALAESLIVQGFGHDTARIVAALRDVGLDDAYRHRYPHQLSGGQRQRVAIARALILGPKLLLLDEPTSALDASVQADILALLRRLKDEHGMTFILVSHSLAVVASLCERAAVMQGGRFVEEAATADLRRGNLLTPYARELFAASQGFHRAAP